MARPRVEIDWDLCDKISQFYLKQEDIADLLDISVDTLIRGVRAKHDLSLADYLHKKRAKPRLMLYQKQFELAMRGNVTLLIWLGKQMLGQIDRAQIDITKVDDQVFIEEARRRLGPETSASAETIPISEVDTAAKL